MFMSLWVTKRPSNVNFINFPTTFNAYLFIHKKKKSTYDFVYADSVTQPTFYCFTAGIIVLKKLKQ